MNSVPYIFQNMETKIVSVCRDGNTCSWNFRSAIDQVQDWTDDLNDSEYDMTEERHMIVFTFENRATESGCIPGPEYDVVRLRDVFENKGFIVKVCENFTRRQIFKKLKKVCKKNHRWTSCVAFVILCELAMDGSAQAADQTFLLKDVVDAVLLAPSLAGKPKLFFNQLYSRVTPTAATPVATSEPATAAEDSRRVRPPNVTDIRNTSQSSPHPVELSPGKRPDCLACSRYNCDPGHPMVANVDRHVTVTIPTHADFLAMTSYEDESSLMSRRGGCLVEALCDIIELPGQDLLYKTTLIAAKIEQNFNNSPLHCEGNQPNTSVKFSLTKSLYL